MSARPRQRAPPVGRERERVGGGEGGGVQRALAGEEERHAQLGQQRRRSRWRPPRRRRGRPGRRRRPGRAPARCPEPRRQLLDGQCATPVPVAPRRATSRVVEVDAVGDPDVGRDPAELVEQLHRPAAEAGEAVALLVEGLGEVGVQPEPQRARQRRRLGHQPGGDAERAARRHGHHDPVAVVQPVVHRLGRGQDRVDVLDDRVGRQPAGGSRRGPSTRGRCACGSPIRPRGRRDRVEDRVVAARDEVVVVGGGRAPRERELGERHARWPPRRPPGVSRAHTG